MTKWKLHRRHRPELMWRMCAPNGAHDLGDRKSREFTSARTELFFQFASVTPSRLSDGRGKLRRYGGERNPDQWLDVVSIKKSGVSRGVCAEPQPTQNGAEGEVMDLSERGSVCRSISNDVRYLIIWKKYLGA